MQSKTTMIICGHFITNDVLDLHLDGDVGIKKVVVLLSIDTNIL